ncbi:hypothetical protein [Mycobacteroides abscessus]|uniref:hypothetical protein n=1 Tax=Mycobacteroides abscessus TaxID=36809 RepID=UPI0010574741|nr:hypothetical protein [Mycobacteroides abscessus]
MTVPAGDRPFSVTRTSGGVRLTRNVAGSNKFIVVDAADVPALAGGILQLVEGDALATTISPTDPTRGGGVLLLDRMRTGVIRMSRPELPSEPWLAMTDSQAVDVALGMLEVAGG